ncbi:MAG: KpsF/GutQ family sugar-phosphate isomerase [Lentisphaerae bacterium]|nr:KpsF/GutQ family sugar-phosphate isomerase [Lentisphaerota bacterium]
MGEFADKAKAVLDLEIEGLEKVRNLIGPAFEAAVGIFLEALAGKGKIVVTGIGKNLHIGEKISASFASTGATSIFLNPTQAPHGDLGVLSEGDVLLAISYSGESEELLMLIPIVRRFGVRIVSITGAPDSRLAGLSDVSIPATVDREACPFNMAPTASTTATLAIGDALAMVLLDARGFRKEDYAKLHPGGTIGRSLLLKAGDIMRSGDRLASLHADATVKEALLAMTSARSGSAVIVDSEGTLAGIFTDGDLRRQIASGHQVLDQPVSEFMTRNPIRVRADQLAVSVLSIFETHAVDDLPVVDGADRLLGAIDIQDLPKFKVM